MAESTVSQRGWELVAEHDGMALVLGAIVELDPAESYTRAELADAAGMSLKDLYLSETITALTDIGLLDRDESDGEVTYAIDDDSPVYERAVGFEQALTE
ncbi:hypothetical protein [Halapricum desulfuricans]|uniref:Putative transcriptional regulator, contains HTH domain n=1 Tax=Halapricum desulfuricans TaxID=2841257 RepID=A0A897NFV7_9EURY|nr:hypothetical protein [Halapricum desulfuricans]QSG09226.1 putative transcriptional regulator, contains HTH domain [Halapricum desulfuricans]